MLAANAIGAWCHADDYSIDPNTLKLHTPELLKKPLPISRPLVNGNPFNRSQKVETQVGKAPANAEDIESIRAQLTDRLVPAIASVIRSEPSSLLIKADSLILRFRENAEIHFGSYTSPEPIIDNGRVMLRTIGDYSVNFLVYATPAKGGEEFATEISIELPSWFHKR